MREAARSSRMLVPNSNHSPKDYNLKLWQAHSLIQSVQKDIPQICTEIYYVTHSIS